MRDRLIATGERVPPIVRLVLAVGAFVGVAAWLTVTTWHNLSASRCDCGPLTDFRDAVYYPLVALRDGVNPYNVDAYFRAYPVGQEFPLYTPIHLIVHAPLVLFSFPTARVIAWGWNLGLTLVFAGVTLRLAGARLTAAAVFGVGTLLLLSDPGKFNLRSGQPTLMIVIAVVLALRAVARGGDPLDDGGGPSRAVSFALGVAAVVIVWSKPTFAIALVVLLIARGRARLAALGTAIAIALSALTLPLLIDTAGGFGPLIDSWRESLRVTSRSGQSRLGSGLRIDVANTFVRVTHLHPSEGIATIAGLVLLAIGAWLVHRLHRAEPQRDRDELAITLACLLMLVCLYHVPYDYLLLAAPVALLARRAPAHPIAWPRRVRVVVPLLLLVPLVDPLGWSPVNSVLGKSGFQWMAGPTMLSVYVLTALGLCVWTALREIRAISVRVATPAGEPSR